MWVYCTLNFTIKIAGSPPVVVDLNGYGACLFHYSCVKSMLLKNTHSTRRESIVLLFNSRCASQYCSFSILICKVRIESCCMHVGQYSLMRFLHVTIWKGQQKGETHMNRTPVSVPASIDTYTTKSHITAHNLLVTVYNTSTCRARYIGQDLLNVSGYQFYRGRLPCSSRLSANSCNSRWTVYRM